MINRLLKIPVRFWRLACAPALPPCCRFYPSCSRYALDALDLHPWPKALWLIASRIVRCNPFCRGGYDPVPLPGGHACGDPACEAAPAHPASAHKA